MHTALVLLILVGMLPDLWYRVLADMNNHNNRRQRMTSARALLVCATTLICALLWAGTADANLQQQRRDFLKAEQLLKHGHRQAFLALSNELRDYPLYPYLRYADLRRRMTHLQPAEVQAFLDAYGDTPLGPRLRTHWLQTLARQHRWATFVRAYRPGDGPALECDYRIALLKAGQHQRALHGVDDLWLSGHSLPDNCDPVLSAWRKAGGLTPALVWQRIHLALGAGNPALARYLERFLPKPQRPWLSAWLGVRRHPSRILQHASHAETPVRQWIVLDGLDRMARIDPEQAADAWRKIRDAHRLTAGQSARMQRHIALALAYAGSPQASDWLRRVGPELCDDAVREWRVRTALAREDWPAVLHWLNQLRPAERDDRRWRYWRARALGALGHHAQAHAIYADLARTRSYEGFLAADRLGTRYHFEAQPLHFNTKQLRGVEKIPGIRRARELFALKRLTDARREWYAATRKMDNAELRRAAKLAQSWGWHDRAILTLGRTDYRNDLTLRFPIVHEQTVMRQAHRAGIDPAWAFAVMRTESAFDPHARSPKGALGLMQLLPRTARRVARSINLHLRHNTQLLHAKLNIRVGIAYLAMVMNSFSDHAVLATAAYNAGRYRVRRWLPEHHALPADIWIETVPYGETRDYLRSVLAYTAIYQRRLGRRPTRLASRMPPVQPPVTATTSGRAASKPL